MNAKSRGACWARRSRPRSARRGTNRGLAVGSLNGGADVTFPRTKDTAAGHGRGEGGKEEERHAADLASPTRGDERGEVVVCRASGEEVGPKLDDLEPARRAGEPEVQRIAHLRSSSNRGARFRPDPKGSLRRAERPRGGRDGQMVKMEESIFRELRTWPGVGTGTMTRHSIGGVRRGG